jgi:hypothetical protein
MAISYCLSCFTGSKRKMLLKINRILWKRHLPKVRHSKMLSTSLNLRQIVRHIKKVPWLKFLQTTHMAKFKHLYIDGHIRLFYKLYIFLTGYMALYKQLFVNKAQVVRQLLYIVLQTAVYIRPYNLSEIFITNL